MSEQALSYEEAIARLEGIVQALDRGEVGLQESISLFQAGLTLVEGCRKQLDKAEGEIKILLNGELTDFDIAQ